MDIWNFLHSEVSQFTRLKGIWFLENGKLNGSCYDYGEAYTGDVSFRDFEYTATIEPKLGSWHGINFRVQGAIRSDAVALTENNKLKLMKNENGYRLLMETDYIWEPGGSYTFTISASGNEITVYENANENITSGKEKELFKYKDTDKPYLSGAVGLSVRDGSRCHFSDLIINGF
jgi:hypothetical protein